MKKLFALLVMLFSAATALAQPLTMKVGEKKQFTATGRAAGAPGDWVSSDVQVATVINSASPALNGMVVAHKPGTTTVTTAGTSIAVTVTK